MTANQRQYSNLQYFPYTIFKSPFSKVQSDKPDCAATLSSFILKPAESLVFVQSSGKSLVLIPPTVNLQTINLTQLYISFVGCSLIEVCHVNILAGSPSDQTRLLDFLSFAFFDHLYAQKIGSYALKVRTFYFLLMSQGIEEILGKNLHLFSYQSTRHRMYLDQKYDQSVFCFSDPIKVRHVSLNPFAMFFYLMKCYISFKSLLTGPEELKGQRSIEIFKLYLSSDNLDKYLQILQIKPDPYCHV